MKASGPALEIGAFEAKNRLSELLDQAAKGQEIWITKRGKRVALLSSGEAHNEKKAADLIADLRSVRLRSRSDRTSLKALVEEGRR
jgi:prevent-host-death family protein